jgi:hypothetical protein
MFLLGLLLVQSVFSQTTYSRSYLKSLAGLEKERIVKESIGRAYDYIEGGIISAAKKGLVEYASEPHFGCTDETNALGIDRPMCEQILNSLHTLVSERFSDSDIIYSSETKRYTLRWG